MAALSHAAIAASIREEQRFPIPHPVHDVQALDPLAAHPVEDEVGTVGAPPDAALGVKRNQREAFGKLGELQTPLDRFGDEADGAAWIVPGE
ncbi:hypothetical protein [Methylorubrum sp. Q1]|uniref:hypothetical protein n=1 Tax=Methylorubrum sp. Q1 TaxID=2562453 RepID=UPI00187D2C9F